MKLTENKSALNEEHDDQLGCEIVADINQLRAFFETSNSSLYKFNTLCHAQHTTQVLLYKMVQDLNTDTTL